MTTTLPGDLIPLIPSALRDAITTASHQQLTATVRTLADSDDLNVIGSLALGVAGLSLSDSPQDITRGRAAIREAAGSADKATLAQALARIAAFYTRSEDTADVLNRLRDPATLSPRERIALALPATIRMVDVEVVRDVIALAVASALWDSELPADTLPDIRVWMNSTDGKPLRGEVTASVRRDLNVPKMAALVGRTVTRQQIQMIGIGVRSARATRRP